jgi:cytochrome o ubiquinol oxidase subunit II
MIEPVADESGGASAGAAGMAYRFGAGAAALLAVLSAGGCADGVLDPHGPIASDEKTILFNSLGIMLAIVIPTIFATLGIAFWFRASNPRARYRPDFQYSGRVEMIVWSIPAMTVMLLGSLCWVGSHDLDPPKPIAATAKPLTVQVVSLDWKWLFIYPEQGIAAVNTLTIPAATPISFELTSSGVMNSFYVPQLGGQIYTMGAMTTRLQLLAADPGSYEGRSANFSGNGFSDMYFFVHAVPPDQFTAWVAKTKSQGPTLDRPGYDELVKPSEAVPPFTYAHVSAGLFGTVVGGDVPPFGPFCANAALDPRRIGF